MKDNNVRVRSYGPSAAQTVIEVLEFNFGRGLSAHIDRTAIDGIEYADVVFTDLSEDESSRVVGILDEELPDLVWVM